MMAEENTPVDFEQLVQEIRERLAQNKRVRRNLPGAGRLRIDRQLPFLCIYREPCAQAELSTQQLVTSEAAYLFASDAVKNHQKLVELLEAITVTMQEHFGVFLIVEIWADDEPAANSAAAPLQPAFRLVTAKKDALPTAIEAFCSALGEIRVSGRQATVSIERASVVGPPGLPPLGPALGDPPNCFVIGLAVRPIYRDLAREQFYPLVLERLRSQLATALRKAIFAFTGAHKSVTVTNPDALGPSTFVKAARLVDQQLCEISESFDFLLQVTPINADEAWLEFSNSGYRESPKFHYRPLAYDPRLLKRRLFDIPIEQVEDATLSHLFWEKQGELDRQLTALGDLDTPAFLHGSLQLYGGVKQDLLDLAEQILVRTPAISSSSQEDIVRASQIARAARDEIDYYHQRLPAFNGLVEVCDDIASSMMVVMDRIRVLKTASVCRSRLEPLLHHEVGTHLLTYINGRQQPFRQLHAGLAGCEALQEGLAVLAEYLVGGLTLSRLRALAGRVVAVHARTRELLFIETFWLLHEQYGFPAWNAFTTTLRAYRGGGLTKDAIYLRGLRDLLHYLAQDHEIEPLYVGKIALSHVPFIQELRRRAIIAPPAILPRFWKDSKAQQRLARCQHLSVLNLLEP